MRTPSFLTLALLALTPAAARAQEDRDAAFAELLTGARLVGYTTLGDSPELKADSYTLKRVSRLESGDWRFEALVEFGGRQIPIAMSFPVEWAGDTPVICVTDYAVPMMGTYSARVLFHGDRYVGLWSGGDHGGELFGRVVRPAPEAQDEAPGAGADAERPGLAAGDWPSFRGFGASGVAEGFEPPTAWDLETGKGLRWRAPVAGLSHASPVVSGDKLFVVTAVRAEGAQDLRVGLYGDIAPVADESEFDFQVQCLDKRDGSVRWIRSAWRGVPAIARHPKGSHAASTPACDARRVVAFFGSEGLYSYDHDGELQWKQDFGVLDSGFYMVPGAQWGFASSPVLHGDYVVVQCDVQGQSFVAALDAATGEEVWRTDRDEVPTWSTPTVDVREGRAQVLCNGWKHIGGYDLHTGAELWKLAGGGDIPVPTPIVASDRILITNAHGRMAPIYCIDANATGALTMDPAETPAMLWSHARGGNYMQTPIAYGGLGYFCSDAGILSCYRLSDGELVYKERLGEGRSGFTGSGIAAGGHLYFTSEEGEVYVVRAGPTFEVVATNSLGEECLSTPAASEGVLYYRTRGHLVALERGDPGAAAGR